MEALVMYKVIYKGSLLIDLPNELKYRILDCLDVLSLKNCRLVCKILCELINNCEKYNKHWILDISHWPVTADQEYVQLYMNSNMKFGEFVGHTNKFTYIPELFKKLGKTVKSIINLPFSDMDFATTKALIENFDKVEDLTLKNNHLLCHMHHWKLTWPSVKRLTIFCNTHTKKYMGNYSEFPNVVNINIEYYNNYNLEAAFYMVKACPKKITGLIYKGYFSACRPCGKLCKIKDLSLKTLGLDHVGLVSEDQNDCLVSCQTNVTQYLIKTMLYECMAHYKDDKQPLPNYINFAYINMLAIELWPNVKFNLEWLNTMPHLKNLRIKFEANFWPKSNDEPPFCFLQSHKICSSPSVSSFVLLNVRNPCFKCLQSIISCFPNLTELKFYYFFSLTKLIENKLCVEIIREDFYHFWQMLNDVLKTTEIAKNLSSFTLYTDSDILDCADNQLFKVMTKLPNMKSFEISIGLVNLSQQNLQYLCDKCPALKKLHLKVDRDFNFHLTGFLVHQLKYLKDLTLFNYDPHLEEAVVEFGPSVIQTLLDAPLKLRTLKVPICCRKEDAFLLFEKFPSLKKILVITAEKIRFVFRTCYYDDLQKNEPKE